MLEDGMLTDVAYALNTENVCHTMYTTISMPISLKKLQYPKLPINNTWFTFTKLNHNFLQCLGIFVVMVATSVSD